MFQHPEHDRDAVAHPYEVAPLLAVGTVVAVRLEQAYLAGAAVLLEEVAHHAHLHAFVVLVGTVDIEELEPYNLWDNSRRRGDLPGEKLVDGILAPSIGVQWLQRREKVEVVAVDEAMFTGTVGGCRRGIDERDIVGGAELEERHRELEIVDDDFVDLLALKLAEKICMPLTEDPEKTNWIKGLAQQKYIEWSTKYGNDNRIIVVNRPRYRMAKVNAEIERANYRLR